MINTKTNKLAAAGDFIDSVIEVKKQLYATSAVVTGSVVKGAANIVEGVGDMLILAGGSVAAGVTSIFDSDASEKIQENVMNIIEYKAVDNAYDSFYQNTALGRSINENSFIEYDSAVAKGITTTAEYVSLIALNFIPGAGTAIAATVAGAKAGGEKAEQLFSDKENRDFWSGAAKATATGIWEGAQWYIGGKIGGTLNATNPSQVTGKLWSNIFTKTSGMSKLAKSGISMASEFVTGSLDPVVRAGIDSIGNERTYLDILNNDYGGWKGIITNGIIAAGTDFAFDIGTDVLGKIKKFNPIEYGESVVTAPSFKSQTVNTELKGKPLINLPGKINIDIERAPDITFDYEHSPTKGKNITGLLTKEIIGRKNSKILNKLLIKDPGLMVIYTDSSNVSRSMWFKSGNVIVLNKLNASILTHEIGHARLTISGLHGMLLDDYVARGLLERTLKICNQNNDKIIAFAKANRNNKSAYRNNAEKIFKDLEYEDALKKEIKVLVENSNSQDLAEELTKFGFTSKQITDLFNGTNVNVIESSLMKAGFSKNDVITITNYTDFSGDINKIAHELEAAGFDLTKSNKILNVVANIDYKDSIEPILYDNLKDDYTNALVESIIRNDPDVSICDIIDAVYEGEMQDKHVLGWGHGSGYYKGNEDLQTTEMIADFATIADNPDAVAKLESLVGSELVKTLKWYLSKI